MMRGGFSPESEARLHWRRAILLNYKFAAQIFTALFGFGCVAQFVLLNFEQKTSPGGMVLYTFPVVVGLLVLFEWSEVRKLRVHIDSLVTRDEDYPVVSIWLSAVLESIAPLAGFFLIGGLLGWPTSLGGPPLVAMVLVPLISILRFDYRICLLQGVVGALGYWLIVMIALSQSNPEFLSEGVVLPIGKGVLLIATGGLAGLIAHQNRRRLHEVIHAQEKRKSALGNLRTRTEEYHRAEDIILEKNELISILSHDMRAPLDGVASLAQLMARAPEKFTPEDVRKYAKEIHRVAHDLRELLDNLVVWAELKSGQVLQPSQPLSLAEQVEQVLRLFEPAITARHLTVEVDVSPDVIVRGDATAVGTVIRNLVSNAVKYTPQDGRITLSVDHPEASHRIALVVTDTGPGMSAARLTSAANPDEEGEQSRTGREGRPELGLALCRQLLRQLDGSLELRAAAGGGTEARMWLLLSE